MRAQEEEIPYALTGFSGAARYAPSVRYQRATAYAAADVDRLAGLLDLKEVPSGGNLVLLSPYDSGVFYGAREIDGVQVVSPIQNYLDVRGLRAHEARRPLKRFWTRSSSRHGRRTVGLPCGRWPSMTG